MNTLITSLFLGCIAGGFIGLICSTSVESIKEKLAIITISIFCIFLISCFGMSFESKSFKSFNNGYCIQCGTKYEAITYRNGQTYYECPNCYYGTWH